VEVDLVAYGNDVTFAVDCKHWKRTVGRGSMARLAEKQILRARHVSMEGRFRRVVPMILTWRDEALFVLESGVPIVPVHRLTDFVLNWEQSAGSLLVFESHSTQRSLIDRKLVF
jgi:hypothetical protein